MMLRIPLLILGLVHTSLFTYADFNADEELINVLSLICIRFGTCEMRNPRFGASLTSNFHDHQFCHFRGSQKVEQNWDKALLPYRLLTTTENTVTYDNALFVCRPKMLHRPIVSSFSWELKWPPRMLKWS